MSRRIPLNARLRFREDEPESQCQLCGEWWPVTPEFWKPSAGLRRCRACILDLRRPKDAAYYRSNEARIKARSAETRARDRRRKQLARLDPVTGPIVREREREAQRRWYHADPERARERSRNDYARRVGRQPTPGIGRPRVAAA